MNLKQFAHAVYVATIRREPHADIYIPTGVALSFIPSRIEIGDFDSKDESAERSLGQVAVDAVFGQHGPHDFAKLHFLFRK